MTNDIIIVKVIRTSKNSIQFKIVELSVTEKQRFTVQVRVAIVALERVNKLKI